MAFSFGFAGDDIDGPDVQMSGLDPDAPANSADIAMEHENVVAPAVRARREELDSLLASLPSRISYSSTIIISPRRKIQTSIYRRELFDVKMQLMAEDGNDNEAIDEDSTQTFRSSGAAQLRRDTYQDVVKHGAAKRRKSSTEVGLGDTDIEQNVYEGGFKSWEGAMDLAQLLLDREVASDVDKDTHFSGRSFLELGCGTALPTLVLFQHALDLTTGSQLSEPITFTLADYNVSVLRLVTLPNLLLTWALHHSQSSLHESLQTHSSRSSPASSISEQPSSTSPNSPARDLPAGSLQKGPGDLTITPTLIEAFKADLGKRGIRIALISGSWADTDRFVSLLPRFEPPLSSVLLAPEKTRHLVLAAETIYSPASLKSFTKTLLAILASTDNALGKDMPDPMRKNAALALIAAKRIYFGVGGGVEEFVASVNEEVERRGLQELFVVNEVVGSGIFGCDREAGGASGGSGVGRWLGEVYMSSKK